jgi:hypothetical protein
MKNPESWHQNTALVVVSLIFCWPFGIVLLWRHPKAPLWAKVVVTAWIVVSILAGAYAVVALIARFTNA